MSRVSNDHILFDECIEKFRPGKKSYIPAEDGMHSKSFLLFPFALTQRIDLGICVIPETIRIDLFGPYCAFISIVENPNWVEMQNSHFFGIALSTIASFIAQSPCKSLREDSLCYHQKLNDYDLFRIGINHPILFAGPGAYQTNLTTSEQNSFGEELVNFIKVLNQIGYDKYIDVMQSIRLAYLSIVNLRDDFGLGYLLIVAAIESIAQKAINRDSVKMKHKFEHFWKLEAFKSKIVKQLYTEYKEARGQNQYLKERYVKFILEYAPKEKWEEYFFSSTREFPYGSQFQFAKSTLHEYDVYPSKLSFERITEILKDSYSYRSNFIHRGKQPPHRYPGGSKFFEEFTEVVKYRKTDCLIEQRRLLPTYKLLSLLFKHSLLNWHYKQTGH